MTNNSMKKDRELNLWREEWSAVAPPSPEFQRQIHERIKLHDRRFLIGNLLTVAVFVGMLAYAVYLSHQPSKIVRGQATGLCVLVFVCVVSRLWILRGTWRAETRSTRAFVELWRRRVLAQIKGLQIGIYLSIGWLAFCAGLAAVNLAAIKFEFIAHPTACLILTVVIAIMLPVIWFTAMWFRRRKVAELKRVTGLLEEI